MGTLKRGLKRPSHGAMTEGQEFVGETQMLVGEIQMAMAEVHELVGKNQMAMAEVHEPVGKNQMAMAELHELVGKNQMAMAEVHEPVGKNQMAVASCRRLLSFEIGSVDFQMQQMKFTIESEFSNDRLRHCEYSHPRFENRPMRHLFRADF